MAVASRVSNALVNGKGYGKGHNRTMLDVRYGNQMGYTTQYTTYVNHTPYIQRNVITKLIAAPQGFLLLDDPDHWIGTLKALWETAANTIEGLNAKLTGDFASVQFGAAGEEQEILRDMKRARTQLSVTWSHDRVGRPITVFHDMWMTVFGMDPDTKHPLMTTFERKVNDYLPDQRSATFLFFEPNEALNGIEKAWLVTDVFPKEGADVTGKFDKNSPGDVLAVTIPFTGIAQVGYGVDRLAQRILDSMNFTQTNPNQRPAFIDADPSGPVDANVATAQTGFSDAIAEASAAAISL